MSFLIRGVAIATGIVVALAVAVVLAVILVGTQPGKPKSRFCPVGTYPGETIPDGC